MTIPTIKKSSSRPVTLNFFHSQVVEAAEDLKLLEAETAELRGKLPLRQAALKAARHEGEAGEGGEKGRGGSEDLSEKSSSLLCIFSFGWKKMTVCSFLKPSVSATFGLLILAQQRLHLGFPIPGAAGNGDFVAKQVGTPAAWTADEGVAKSGGFLYDGFWKWHKDLVIICFGGDEVTQWFLKWHKTRSVICFGDQKIPAFFFF